jgi:hypothetical protein
MSDDQLAVLTRLLRLARRNLADEAPGSPAWEVTTKWLDDLEREIRELGRDLGALLSIALSERRLGV